MRQEVIRIFSKRIRSILERTTVDSFFLEEIRLRSGQPLVFRIRGKNTWIDSDGCPVEQAAKAYQVLQEDIRETMEYVSHYSLYAFEEEIRQGFITVPGGHRVGLTGRAVMVSGELRSIKNISFLNVRLAHQVIGCGDKVMPYLWRQEELGHTLIISPPGMGKTTLLRDLIRQISNGGEYPPMSIAVADERSEIAACYGGVPQNDLGPGTDVLDGCPKAVGIRMLIRTMSPQVIAMDEVGSAADVEALAYGMHCGCSVLATVHGNSPEDVRQKPRIRELLRENSFDTYVVLKQDTHRNVYIRILDKNGRTLSEVMR